MKKYIEASIVVNGQKYHMSQPLDDFKQQHNVEIDLEGLDEDVITEDDVDEFTSEEIEDIVVSHFNDNRHSMGINYGEEIHFLGFKILNEDHEDLLASTYFDV